MKGENNNKLVITANVRITTPIQGQMECKIVEETELRNENKEKKATVLKSKEQSVSSKDNRAIKS